MTRKSGPQVGGRTNWKRFGLVIVPFVAAATALTGAAAQGAVPVTISISGHASKITADELHGKGFVQYGSLSATPGSKVMPMARAGMKTAELVNMCQSVVFELDEMLGIPILGDYTLRIEAGTEKGKPVKATNIFIDMTDLSGDADFSNIAIGVDASTVTKGPAKGPGNVGKGTGMQGMFAQQADTIDIIGLEQTMYATQAESFALTGLSLALKPGRHECQLARP